MATKKRFYPEEVKQAVIQMKLSGKYTTSEIMERYQIKNRSQIATWLRWIKDGEEHRLAQGVGQQYTFNKGIEELSEVEVLKKKILYYEMRDEMLEKYREIERKWNQKYSLKS